MSTLVIPEIVLHIISHIAKEDPQQLELVWQNSYVSTPVSKKAAATEGATKYFVCHRYKGLLLLPGKWSLNCLKLVGYRGSASLPNMLSR